MNDNECQRFGQAGALIVPAVSRRQSVVWEGSRTVMVKEIQGMSGGKMRAWVLTRPGELKLQEVAIPEISENQVLVEIERACICNGSDPGIYHGHEAYQTPMVFGHEASGRIIRKGRKVEQFQVGDRVCWWFEAGAFAEYQAVTVDNVAMFRVPENLSLDEGPVLELVLASCRVIMELPAAEDRKSMVICGLGPSGLVLLQYAKALGYERLTGWDLYEQRRELALSLGADAVCHPGELTVEAVKEMAQSDVGVAMMGDDLLPGEPTMTLLMRAVRPGGMIVSYGHPEQGCRFSPYVFQSRNLRMQGPVNNMDIIRSRGEEIMEMVAEGRIQIGPLITHRTDFEDFLPVFEKVLNRPEEQIKVILKWRDKQ